MEILGTTAAIIAVLFWIISGSISKKVVKGLGSNLAALILVSVGIIPMVFATVLVGVYSIPLYTAAVAAFAGIFLALGFILIYLSLRTENLANASALSEVQPALLVVFGLVAFSEAVSPLQIFSMIIIFAGSLLVIVNRELKINRRLIPAFLANVSWATYWILMTYAITNAGTFALPLLISRIIGIAVAVAWLLAARKQGMGLKELWGNARKSRVVMVLLALVLISAVADGVGDTSFSIAAGSNVLAIAGAISALSPMIVAFSGFLFYKEKITRMELVGIIVMVAGAIALSVL